MSGIDSLVLAEHHRVVVADSLGQQPLGVVGIAGRGHLDPRYRDQQRIQDGGVLRTGAGAGADHGSDGHRRGRPAAEHVAEFGNLVHELVEAHA